MQNALCGRYNAQFAQFFAKNRLDYKEKADPGAQLAAISEADRQLLEKVERRLAQTEKEKQTGPENPTGPKKPSETENQTGRTRPGKAQTPPKPKAPKRRQTAENEGRGGP